MEWKGHLRLRLRLRLLQRLLRVQESQDPVHLLCLCLRLRQSAYYYYYYRRLLTFSQEAGAVSAAVQVGGPGSLDPALREK
jgi:hypothetical protein